MFAEDKQHATEKQIHQQENTLFAIVAEAERNDPQANADSLIPEESLSAYRSYKQKMHPR